MPREYYYNIKGNMEPDLESMTAFLLDEFVLFIHNIDEFVSMSVNCNDHFVPAADSERISEEDIPKLFDLYKEKGYDGVYEFVADKRKIENKHWREDDLYRQKSQ